MTAEAEKPGPGNAATPEPKAEASASAPPAKPSEPSALMTAEPEVANATPEGAPQKTEPPKREGAPERYADFKLPEGRTLDPEALTELSVVAKALDLPQAGAQAVLDMGLRMRDRILASQKQALAAQGDEWRRAAEVDPDIGGARLKDACDKANDFMSIELGKERWQALSAYLKATQLCNHPDLIRVLAKAGRVTSQDRAVLGGGVRPDTFLDDLYSRTPAKT